MSTGARIAIAIAVILADAVLFVLPLTGMLAAYVIIARPPWFRALVERLYKRTPAPPNPGPEGA